jgi:hypothetical protein
MVNRIIFNSFMGNATSIDRMNFLRRDMVFSRLMLSGKSKICAGVCNSKLLFKTHFRLEIPGGAS